MTTTYRRVTGPGYSCLCPVETDPCPPCPTAQDRARLYQEFQRSRLPIRMPGAVRYFKEQAR